MVVKEATVKSGGIELNVFTMGNAEGKPVVLVHGLRDSAKSLFLVGAELAKKYLVLIPDLRGHGASPRFSSYQMPDFLGDLHETITSLTQGSCALFGHSLGGHIASRYSALFPETIRCLMLVEGLGPPNKKHENESDYVRYYRNSLESRLINAKKGLRPLQNLDHAVDRLMVNNPRMDKKQAEELAENLTVRSNGLLHWNFDPKANGVFIGASQLENEKFWRQVECPTCIVSGVLSHEYWSRELTSDMRSGYFQEGEMEQRASVFQNAQHYWFENSGHMVHYDEPDRLANLCMGFLEEKYD